MFDSLIADFYLPRGIVIIKGQDSIIMETMAVYSNTVNALNKK